MEKTFKKADADHLPNTFLTVMTGCFELGFHFSDTPTGIVFFLTPISFPSSDGPKSPKSLRYLVLLSENLPCVSVPNHLVWGLLGRR